MKRERDGETGPVATLTRSVSDCSAHLRPRLETERAYHLHHFHHLFKQTYYQGVVLLHSLDKQPLVGQS